VKVNDLERLMAIESIKQLKARFLRCMDTKDWDGFAATLSDDAVLDMSQQGSEVLEGGARVIADWTRDAIDAAETVHQAHCPEIEVTSADSATGVWALMDVLRWPEGGAISEMVTYGHYHESYVRVAGAWKISRIYLTDLRIDITEGTGPAPTAAP
jgi:hypothetical protein